jgi:phosphoribosyl 1,2-cyclic phosphodiesterase
MRLCSIASGSSGNCIYIGSDKTHLLVDTGISKKKIEEGLAHLELDGENISGILITHEHSDHIQGLVVFSRRYHVPIYASKGTIEGIKACKSIGEVEEDLLHVIETDQITSVGDIAIQPFSISHDANEPTGFRMESNGKRVAVATDLGYYDDYIIEKLKDLHGIVLESNHDIHMVEVGPYPYPLKQRVLGNKGHLSNEFAGRLLCEILHDDLKHIVLGHLSKDNNFPELAYETVKLEVTMSDVPYHGNDIPLMVAKRDQVSQVLYL